MRPVKTILRFNPSNAGRKQETSTIESTEGNFTTSVSSDTPDRNHLSLARALLPIPKSHFGCSICRRQGRCSLDHEPKTKTWSVTCDISMYIHQAFCCLSSADDYAAYNVNSRNHVPIFCFRLKRSVAVLAYCCHREFVSNPNQISIRPLYGKCPLRTPPKCIKYMCHFAYPRCCLGSLLIDS